jgi:hypothetical protein
LGALVLVDPSWWSIGDAKITLGENPEHDIKEIRELLDENNSDATEEPRS